MSEYEKMELRKLKDFRARFFYLFDKNWSQSRRQFIETHDVGRTTFYDIWNGKKKIITDYIIEEYARAFNVSFEFLKFGGEETGYHVERYPTESKVCEDGSSYGSITRRNRGKINKASGKADITITANDSDQILEILMRIKYRDIDF